MKILQINKYHYVRGGSDSVYFNTSALLRNRGHHVSNFAMKFPENVACDEDVFFAEKEDFTQKSFLGKVSDSIAFFYNKDAAEKLEKLIVFNKPDVAHLHIFYGSLTSSILQVLKKHNIPAIVSVHDYKFVCPAYLFLNGKNEICEKCEGSRFYHAITNKCAKSSYVVSTMFALESYYRDNFYPLHRMFSRLLFVSKFSRDIHLKYKPELTDKALHLYNFDPSLSSDTNFKSQRGQYFLYAGRLSREKGLQTLISAFVQMPDLELKVVGDGGERESLENQASNNISFLGFKKGDELKSIISNCSFVIVPSEWYENNPMAIIEAYALGKPVIAAAIGGISEIVNVGTTGYLYTPGNVQQLKSRIEEATILPDLAYEEMSRAAFEFACEKFSPDKHIEELIRIYEEMIRNP